MGASLCSCTVMILRLHADLMGLALSRIQVSVSHHSGYPDSVPLFERTIFLEGPISAGDKLRLLEVAQRGPVDLALRAAPRFVRSSAPTIASAPLRRLRTT
jgi:hypothetical protein